MRKKLLVVLLVLTLCVTGAFAKGKSWEPGADPLMAPGDLALSAGLGYGFFWGAIDVSGGVEFMLGKFMLGDTIPITYGVAGKASYYRYTYYSSYHAAYIGAGGFGTLHLSLKDLDLSESTKWMNRADVYIGLGAGFYGWSESWTDSSEFRIGLRAVGGVNYFLNDHIAITFEGGSYGGWGGGLIGILFKL